MSIGVISALEERARKIGALKKRAEQTIDNGYLVELVPEAELSFWFKLLRFLLRFIGVNLSQPTRKRPLTDSERDLLRDRVNEFAVTISQINAELKAARKKPELKPIPGGLVESGDGYPGDWEQISLQHRNKVGFVCEDCGAYAPDGHVHHIHRVSKGGGSNEDNLLFLCRECHAKRHPHMEEY